MRRRRAADRNVLFEIGIADRERGIGRRAKRGIDLYAVAAVIGDIGIGDVEIRMQVRREADGVSGICRHHGLIEEPVEAVLIDFFSVQVDELIDLRAVIDGVLNIDAESGVR